jgi:hypothetical protein
MRRNSGIIGPLTTPSLNKTTGVFDVEDQNVAKSKNTWPLTQVVLSVSPSSNVQYNEGSTFVVTVNTMGFANGSILYYTIETVTGTINTSDFSDGLLSGSFTISSNTGTISKTLVLDATSETSESFIVRIRATSVAGPILMSTGTITINNPSFSVAPSASSVNEGSSLTWNVNTTNINSPTTFYYTLTGAASSTVPTTSGSFSVSSNSGSFAMPTVADSITTGNQTVTCQIRIGSTGGTICATNTCVVNDTSQTPVVTVNNTSIDENDSSAIFTITTTGLANGTVLYWTTNLVSGTINTSDFTDGALVGSVTVNSNTATITRTIRNDYVTEGSESFNLSIRTTSTSGTIVATSPTVTINDTSLTPTATITPDVSTVDEGGTVTFTVATTNFPSGTLYWTTNKVGSYNIRETDFSDGVLSGTVMISGSTGTFTRTLANDGFTEGTEQFTMSLRTFTTNGIVIGTSSAITVNDTSTGLPEPSYDLISATFTMRRTPTNDSTVAKFVNVVYSPVTNNFWTQGCVWGPYNDELGVKINVYNGYVAYSTDGDTWTLSATRTNFATGFMSVVPTTGTILGTQLAGYITRIAGTTNNTTVTNINTQGIGSRDYASVFTQRLDGSIIGYDSYSGQPSAVSTNDGVSWSNITTVPNRTAYTYYWDDAGVRKYYISDWGTNLTYYSLDGGVTTAGSFTYFGYITGYQNFLVGLNGATLYIYEMNGAAYTVKATIAATSGYTWQTAAMVDDKSAFIVEAKGTTFADQACNIHKINDITVASPVINQSRTFTGLNTALQRITYVPHQKRLYLAGTYGGIATLAF